MEGSAISELEVYSLWIFTPFASSQGCSFEVVTHGSSVFPANAYIGKTYIAVSEKSKMKCILTFHYRDAEGPFFPSKLLSVQ